MWFIIEPQFNYNQLLILTKNLTVCRLTVIKTMSNHVSVGIKPERKQNVKQLTDYANELTKEWGLKKFGYDITIPTKDWSYFETNKRGFSWNFMSRWNFPVETFIKKITEKFPQTPMRMWETWEGPIVYEAIYRNGEWQEVEKYAMGVCVENCTDFNVLVNMINDKELLSNYHVKKAKFIKKEHFVVLNFEELTKSEQKQAFNSILEKITKLIPQSHLFCILIREWEHESVFVKTCQVENGEFMWRDITNDDLNILRYYSDYGENNKPNPEIGYVKLLCKDGEERETLLANIPVPYCNEDGDLPF